MKEASVEMVMTYGNPSFYSKVGFQPVRVEVVQPPFELEHPEGWIGQSLVSDGIIPILGKMTCAKALNNPVYW